MAYPALEADLMQIFCAPQAEWLDWPAFRPVIGKHAVGFLAAEVVSNAFLLTDTKNGDRRIVPAHAKVQTCIKHLPLPVKKRWIQRQFSEAPKALGMGHFPFHDMRHSPAYQMINIGANLYEVGAVLGLRSLQSTKHYAPLATDAWPLRSV